MEIKVGKECCEECRWGAHLPSLGCGPIGGSTTEVCGTAHGQCDARPTVTFPAAGHHRLLTGEKCSINLDKTHACNGHITIIYKKNKKKLHHLASVVPFPLRSVATITWMETVGIYGCWHQEANIRWAVLLSWAVNQEQTRPVGDFFIAYTKPFHLVVTQSVWPQSLTEGTLLLANI